MHGVNTNITVEGVREMRSVWTGWNRLRIRIGGGHL
jgi:hypothetical protein